MVSLERRLWSIDSAVSPVGDCYARAGAMVLPDSPPGSLDKPRASLLRLSHETCGVDCGWSAYHYFLCRPYPALEIQAIFRRKQHWVCILPDVCDWIIVVHKTRGSRGSDNQPRRLSLW